jgi:hypothetical protein
MTAKLDELVESLQRSLVQGTYNDNDITAIINIALSQRDTLSRLAEDNERLSQACAHAGEHITKLEAKIDSLSGLATAHHLVQYAEESHTETDAQ